MIEGPKTHPLAEKLKEWKHLSMCVQFETRPYHLANQCGCGALIEQRLGNPFDTLEQENLYKPGPLLAYGRKIKIKDMTKKKLKTEKKDKKDKKKVKKKGDELDAEINEVFKDDKKMLKNNNKKKKDPE